MEWFFGLEESEGRARHRPVMTIKEIRRAKEICERCPVIDECLTWALTNREEFGIWGATTGRERSAWWKQNNLF